jgi:hypothetical protein
LHEKIIALRNRFKLREQARWTTHGLLDERTGVTEYLDRITFLFLLKSRNRQSCLSLLLPENLAQYSHF